MLFAAVLVALVAPCAAQFKNQRIEQDVDLSASYARLTTNVWAENIGGEELATYIVPFSEEDWSKIALFEAQSSAGLALEVEAQPAERQYTISLLGPVEPGRVTQFAYATAFRHKTRPLPAVAEQIEQQKMVYEGSEYIYSAYDSDLQTITTKFAGPTRDVSGEPLHNVPAFSSSRKPLHYENPQPQPHVTEYERTIWISHWGDAVSIDERYDLTNNGTRLKKPFSRVDFMNHNYGGMNTLSLSSVRQLRIPTGPGARDHYYVDLVGNVSTSSISEGFLDIVTRFPLFGGWRTEFTVGWTSPLGAIVKSLGKDMYALQVPVVGGPDGVAYDSVETTIVLPEGATNVRIVSEEAEGVHTDTIYNYLDLQGRPFVTILFKNLVAEHKLHTYTVIYEYTTLSALRKPVAYSAAVFALFLAAKLLSGLDLSIKNVA